MTAEARIMDAQGRILAHGTSTMMTLGNGGNTDRAASQ
jgi:hypothetical protein